MSRREYESDQRVNRRAVIFIHPGSPERELGEIGFSDDLHVALPRWPHQLCVAAGGWICFGQMLRSRGRDLTLQVDKVFDREAKLP